MKRVYVAGPYSKGDVVLNIRAAVFAGELLSQAGHTPLVPHAMTFVWHMLYPHMPQFWYKYDLEWLKVCDCLLRLPGESVGADLEVLRARELNIPVYSTVKELVEAYEHVD